jgi:hypothetical protein
MQQHLGDLLKAKLAEKQQRVQLELDLRHVCPMTAIPMSATKATGKAVYKYEQRMNVVGNARWASEDCRNWVRHAEFMYYHELEANR